MRLLICLFFILLASTASAVTIGFEGVVADDGTLNLSDGYTESSFIFSSYDGRAAIVGKDRNRYSDYDSASLNWCGFEGYNYVDPPCLYNTVTLSHEDGAFSLQSFVGGGSDFEYSSEPTLIVSGQLADGSVLIEEVDISGSGMQTIIMSSAWTNLESVSFSAKVMESHCCSASFNGRIDNIVVTAVPLPAAVWLFGSGLGLLGWMKRNRLTVAVTP